jgi:crossover junction endodeoxyribonuclease RuvC
LKILKDESPDHIYIEKVSAQFGNGAASAFTFGFVCGVIESCVVSLAIPFTYVTPQAWKKAMDCPADKDGARQRATQLLPHLAHNWTLKRQDGVAEAALIALYGINKSRLGEMVEKYCSTNV